jgi:hypothetical protein
VRSPTGIHNGFDVVVEYVDTVGAVLTTAATTVAPSSLAAGVWTPVTVIAQAPAGTLKVSKSISVTDTAVNGVLDFDDGEGLLLIGGDIVDDGFQEAATATTPAPGVFTTIDTLVLQMDYPGQTVLVNAHGGIGYNLAGNEVAAARLVIEGVPQIGQRITNPAGGGGATGGAGGHGHSISGSTGGGGSHNHFNSGTTTSAGIGSTASSGVHTHGGTGTTAGHSHSIGTTGTSHTHSIGGNHSHIWFGITTTDGGHGHSGGSLGANGVGDHSHSIPAGSNTNSMVAWDHSIRRITPGGATLTIELQALAVVGTPDYVSRSLQASATRLRHEQR